MNVNINTTRIFELKKHINAIHCTNNLTLVQRKLFNALLFNAYPALSDKSRFQIKAKELCRLIGYNSNDYAKLKHALLGLITIAIEWNVIDCKTGTEKRWKASSILASAELANGICEYEYSHVMRELLFKPEIYGRINIKLMAKFKSSYGLALYENCIRYQGLPQTPWFTLEVFRKLIGVMGNKYSAFKDFKKRVLNVAINEVNKISPINVEVDIERENQKVVKLRFKLTKTDNDRNSRSEVANLSENVRQILLDIFSFSEQMIEQSIMKYGIEYLKEKVEMIVQSNSFQSGKIRGLTGYLIQALRGDYKPSKSSKTIIDEQRKKEEDKQLARKKQQEDNERDYSDYVNEKITTYINSLKNHEHNELLSNFEKHINASNIFIKKWYFKHKFEHPAVKSYFNNFIKSQNKQISDEILSFEEFRTLISEFV